MAAEIADVVVLFVFAVVVEQVYFLHSWQDDLVLFYFLQFQQDD